MKISIKHITFLLILVPFALHAQMEHKYIQKYWWTKRFTVPSGVYTVGNPSFYQHDKKLYQFIPFSGDSICFDSVTLKSDKPSNILIAVCDLKGVLKHSFLLKGISLIEPLFTEDGGFYIIVDGTRDLYSGNQSFNKLTNTAPSSLLLKCNIDGHLTAIDTFYVSGNVCLRRRDIDGNFFAMFSNITYYDSLFYKDSLFQYGKTTLIEFSSAGKRIKKRLLNGIFSNFSIWENRLDLYGKTSEIPLDYTIANKRYSRNVIDINTQDIVMGAYNLKDEKFIWHEMIRTNGGLLTTFAGEHSFLVAVGYNDTISFRGRRINSDTSIHSDKTILLSFSNNGLLNWYKTSVNGNSTMSNIQVTKQKIHFLVYTYPTLPGEFSWDHTKLQTASPPFGSYRLTLDEMGNKVSFTPIPHGYPSSLYFGLNPYHHYLNYWLKDTVTFDAKYKISYNQCCSKEFLFTSAYSYDSIELAYKPLRSNATVNTIFEVFPNPTTTKFKLKGLALNAKAPVEISIYDVNGDLALSKIQNLSEEVDVSSLKVGVYFLSVVYNGKHYSTKFMKN